jgi:cytochrome P450
MSSTPPIALPEAWQTSLTTHLLSLLSTIPLLPLLLLIPTTILLLLALHRTYNHPLSQIPGPLLSRLTSLPLYISSYLGHEARLLTSLHALHGPIIRIGPNEVLISDGAVLPQIYTTSENASKGGFLKAPCYENFHGENGHETIFSTLDPEYRKTRARAVMPLFGAGEIRRGSAVLEGCVGRLVGRLRREAKESLRSKRKVDVLALARMWALDSVSAYLFGEGYGALEQGVTAGYEDSGKEEGNGEIHLDAAAYVDSITAFGRFFFLPNELFLRLMGWIEYFAPDPQAAASLAKVDEYVTPMVDRAAAGEEKLVGTFQDRLLKAGISKEETAVQVKDVIFAGTDTTAMNLATIIWWLARKPEV